MPLRRGLNGTEVNSQFMCEFDCLGMHLTAAATAGCCKRAGLERLLKHNDNGCMNVHKEDHMQHCECHVRLRLAVLYEHMHE